ncbi:hypothetical protein E5676_scaffold572G00350 [Cucumis melo var. makuwa]|uniref:Uncharacterized protein n=2 Tax=Cucumis melo TaxID=3656 RepID=A0A5D3C6Y4_CUCMM|nr:hypothetical protein E5676_scaffold572G00350 [Cucumis melo var. makuwa]
MKILSFLPNSKLHKAPILTNICVANLDYEHLNLNVPIANLSKREAEQKKAAENAVLFNPDLPLIVYDPLFQDIPMSKDAGEISSVEGAQSEDEALAENEGEFHELLHNVIAEPMNTVFKEVLLDNVSMKEQIASLNTKV